MRFVEISSLFPLFPPVGTKMNQAERELIASLSGLKGRKIGFVELRTDVEHWCADIHLDARYNLFTSECIFDIAKWLGLFSYRDLEGVVRLYFKHRREA